MKLVARTGTCGEAAEAPPPAPRAARTRLADRAARRARAVLKQRCISSVVSGLITFDSTFVTVELVNKGQQRTTTVVAVATESEGVMAPTPRTHTPAHSETKHSAGQTAAFFVFLLCTLLTLGDWFGLLG